MQIYINGKQAALKSGSSFDFVSENRAFTGSDSYTMSITFPLAGCQQNLDIFGHLNRKDVDANRVTFLCDIRDLHFFRSGVITITELSEVEVKCQFLEGRSEQNFNTTFDEIYIQDLDLGAPKSSDDELYVYRTTAETCLKSIDQGRNYVALPFVNNASGNLLNKMRCNSKGAMRFAYQDNVNGNGIPLEDRNNAYISWMPYLIFIAKKVCDAVGYTYDFSQWENSKQRFLVVCNTLPAVWTESGFKRDFRYAMPHWSVKEFFQQLEYLLWGEFDIDHKEKSISFGFIQTNNARIPSIYINKVIDEFTSELTEEDESEYIDNYDLSYKDNGSTRWQLLTCDWYLRTKGHLATRFKTYAELKAFTEKYKCVKGYDANRIGYYSYGIDDDKYLEGLFYVENIDTYFILYNWKAVYNRSANGRKFYDRYFKLMPVGIFSNRVVKADNSNAIELGIVPVWIDDTDEQYGEVVFLNCGELNESDLPNRWSDWSVSFADDINNFADGILNGAIVQNQAARAINQGEKKEMHEFFSNLYVAYWDNMNGKYRLKYGSSQEFQSPCPIVDSLFIDNNNILLTLPYSLRLNDGSRTTHKSVNIEATQKYTFKWLSNEMPNPRSIFIIHGKKYLCKKITATFTEKGMSQQFKGEFYRLQD